MDGSAPLSGLPARYGSRFFTEGVPEREFPAEGMGAPDAYNLIAEEMELDGDPGRNLATFVTTWMELPAREMIKENMHRNFIDHAEYPRTAEIEQRCIRMLADLYHAPAISDEIMGARCQGSSEAIMLGALAAKWRWRAQREADGKDTSKPNLVFGNDVHVVWDKFCRYFDVEPRAIPLKPGKYVIGPEDVEPHLDENTIAVAAVLGTTFTGEADDVAGIDELLRGVKEKQGLDIPIHVDGASGGFVWPFTHPDEVWDFQLEQVRSINVSGHKFGMVYPGIGWLVFRDPGQLPKDLVFYENYLGKTDATFTLNFSTGAAVMLAQYYNFCRFGRHGYTEIMKGMKRNADYLAQQLTDLGGFDLIGRDKPQLPLLCFQLSGSKDELGYDAFDLVGQLEAERGWMIPAYTMPPDAEEVVVMRALVKENVSHAAAHTLDQDIAEARATLEQKGGLHPADRKRVKTGTGY